MVWHAQLVITADDQIARDLDVARTPDVKNKKEIKRSKRKRKRIGCCEYLKSSFNLNGRKILAVLVLLLVTGCVTLIGVSISGAIVIRSYSVGQSNLTAGLVMLGVTAALCLVLGVYAALAPLDGERKTLYVISTALMILAISQTALVCTAIIMSQESETDIVQSLTLSFLMARAQSMTNVRVWARTQSDLGCCGLNGARDYSSMKPAWLFNVPLPCCYGYDPSRSEILQSVVQEECRTKGTYFKTGCKEPVVKLFKETLDVISKVAICVVVLEVLTSVFGLTVSMKSKEEARNVHVVKNTTAPNVVA